MGQGCGGQRHLTVRWEMWPNPGLLLSGFLPIASLAKLRHREQQRVHSAHWSLGPRTGTGSADQWEMSALQAGLFLAG